ARGGGDNRALRKWNSRLQRLLLGSGICFRGERICGRACAAHTARYPADRERGVVVIRIKIISGGGDESVDRERAVGDCGGRAVGARNCEAGPRPGDRGGGGEGVEAAGPGGGR